MGPRFKWEPMQRLCCSVEPFGHTWWKGCNLFNPGHKETHGPSISKKENSPSSALQPSGHNENVCSSKKTLILAKLKRRLSTYDTIVHGMQRDEPNSSNEPKHWSRTTKNKLTTIQVSGSGHVPLKRNPLFPGGWQWLSRYIMVENFNHSALCKNVTSKFKLLCLTYGFPCQVR